MADHGPEVSNVRRWMIASMLFTSGFINYLDRAIVSLALPVVAIDLHLGPTAKGVLLSAFFWSYSAMQLPMGWLSDRFNLRWAYAGAFALWSLACGFTGFAGTIGALIVLRILLGVGESIYLPAGMKIVSLFFNSTERGLVSGFVNCGTRAGLALGAPLIASLIIAFGWKNSFFLLGFGSLIWLVPWLSLYPARSTSTSVPHRSEGGRPREWLHRNLLALSAASICYGYYWYLLVTWLPDYLVVSRHLPLQKAGTFAAIPYAIYAAAEPVGGWIADLLVRHGWNEMRSRKMIITISFLTSLLFLPVGYVASDMGAILLIGGAALVGLSSGNILALLQRVAPADQVGWWTGVYNFSGNLSGIVAPLATGLLIARTGSYYPGFVLAVAVLLAGLPFYWMVRDREDALPQETRGA